MTLRGWAFAGIKAVLLTASIALMVVVIVRNAQAATLPAGMVPDWQTPGPWVDWRTYANATERMLAGQAIFAPEQLAGPYLLTHVVMFGYAYPPPATVLFLPFVSYPFGLAAFMTLNLGLFFTALWAIVSRAWPRYRVPIFAVLLILLAFNGPFIAGVISANVNVGIAGLIGWAAVGWPGRARDVAGGVALGVIGGIAAIVKLFPGVLALTGPQKLRPLVVSAAVIACISLVTLPLVGVGSWIDFVKALSGAVPDCYPENHSIACTLGPTIGLGNAALVGAGIGGVAALAMLFVRDRLVLCLLATVAIMAPVSNLHTHYWIMAYVAALAIVAGLWERLRTMRALRLAAEPTGSALGMPTLMR